MTVLSKHDSFDFKTLHSVTNSITRRRQLVKERGNKTELYCNVCFKPSSQLCSACFISSYCSEKCRRKDEKRHIKVCGKQTGVVLQTDPPASTDNPHYCFVKSLPQGSVVFEEEPVVKFPTLPAEYGHNDGKRARKLVCFCCHAHFYPELDEDLELKFYGCSKCGLFKCRPDCPEEDHHRSGECVVLQKIKNRDFKSYLETKRKYGELYLDICALRLLVRLSTDPVDSSRYKIWRKFTDLSKTPRFKAYKKTDCDYQDGIEYMKFLKKSVDSLKFSMAYAQQNGEILQQVLKTMLCFWEVFELEPSSMLSCRLLFIDRHFMSHSYCTPNIAVNLSYNSPGVGTYPKWQFYLTRDINLSMPNVCTKVTFDFSPRRFMPIPLRMMYLKSSGLECAYNKDCNCSDPTDGSSHTGTIRCIRCHDGPYVEDRARVSNTICSSTSPDFPERWTKDYIAKVDWKCALCDHFIPFSIIFTVLKTIEDKYYQGIQKSSGVNKLTAIVQFVNFYENSYVFESNGTLLQAKFDYLVAAQRRHFRRCQLNRFGFPLEFTKYHVAYLTKIWDKPEVKLFRSVWSPQEMMALKTMKTYARICARYLENTTFVVSEGPDLDRAVQTYFLILLNEFCGIVLHCYHWLSTLNEESAAKFCASASTATILFQTCLDNSTAFKRLCAGNSDPLFKWPCIQMGQLAEKLRPFLKSPLLLTKVILTEMGIPVGRFLMDGGDCDIGILNNNFEGLENWPLDGSTYPTELEERAKIEAGTEDGDRTFACFQFS